MDYVIKNGIVVDPTADREEKMDVRVRGGRIFEVGCGLLPEAGEQTIDADGCYVMPGLIDLHVHLRDPGITYKETLETGGAAAVRGGVTTVCAMPNTKPVIDTAEAVEDVHGRAKSQSAAHVIQLGAVTKGQRGEELAEIAQMAQAGCHAISEDGKSVMNASLYRKAMRIAAENHISVFAHCEDIHMVEGGVMNAGEKAEKLGNKGITNAVEDVIVARDILLAKETGVQLHLCHCSTKDSVRMIRLAKQEGLPVSGEVCPHHFLLTDEDIPGDDGNFKMNPPLRAREDVRALVDGLADGTIDAIATDHAPHAEHEKNVPMAKAAFGIVGLETAAALTYTHLVRTGILSVGRMVELMSTNPARILGLSDDRGALRQGMRADIIVFDPEKNWVIDKNDFASKGKNTPFDGYEVTGKVKMTFVDGQIMYKEA